jgi:hypothetical protein
MKALWTMIGVVAMALAVAGAARADTVVYSENFEGMSDGTLQLQGGWSEGNSPFDYSIAVGTGGALTNRQILAYASAPDHMSVAVHSLGSIANLDASQVSTLTWDSQYGSANSNFGLDAGNGANAGMAFGFESTGSGWVLDPRSLLGIGDGSRVFLTGGTSGPVHFTVVIDGPGHVISGGYDFGSGYVQAGAYLISDAQIQSVVGLMTFQDYRSGRIGIGMDNIALTTIPEPCTITLLGSSIIGLLAYAWRKRR